MAPHEPIYVAEGVCICDDCVYGSFPSEPPEPSSELVFAPERPAPHHPSASTPEQPELAEQPDLTAPPEQENP